MHLKRLEIRGFKTFESHTNLEFRPGISAIVGPNGSGKSNIADAIRWVLGEQSYTALRCKRSEELLFSGSERRAPAGVAEVSLTIDNSDGLLPLDFEEVTISRRTVRGGENEYLLNHKKVRLRDIQEATEPLGSSYTIINQGLVDTALTLRPEERRRLFEHAAELGSFEARRDEAERRLQETEANMQRTADLLSEIEPRLRSLKRQATQARQHRELSEELHRLLLVHYAAQWHAASAQVATTEEHLARLRAELEQARSSQQAADEELHRLRETLQQRQHSLQVLYAQRAELEGRSAALQRQQATSQERLAALEQRMDELAQTRSTLDSQQEQAQQEGHASAAALETATAELAEQRRLLAACQQEAASYEVTRHAREQALSEAQNALFQANSAVAEQRSRIEHLLAQRERMHQDQENLQASVASFEQQAAEARQQVRAAQAALTDAEAERDTAAQAVETSRSTHERLRKARRAADDTLAAARRAHADAQARLDTLNRLASSYTGTFPGVRAAMQWAERSGQQGFALVSSILQVPAALETAIEIALGSRLQNIVVERWEDAEAAIAELKRSRAGRATFLPLDSIRQAAPHEPRIAANWQPGGADIPPVLGVAADLVGYEPHYHNVAWQLLGRTLIVRDLPTARQELRRLSGGWLIVTLEGEQVNSGGALTGGTQNKESGTLQRERELRELPTQVQHAQAAAAEAAEHCRSLEERIAEAERATSSAEQRQREAARTLAARQNELDQASRRAAQLEQELAWRQERQQVIGRDSETLSTQHGTLVEQLEQAEASAAAARSHLDSLQASQQSDIHADHAMQERLSDLRAALVHAEAQIETRQTLHQANQHSLQRIQQQQHDLAQRHASLHAEREQLAAAFAERQQAHNDLHSQLDALQAQIDPLEEALRAERTRQTEIEQQEKAVTSGLLERESACNRADLEQQRARDRLENLSARAAHDGIDLAQECTPDASPPPAEVPADLAEQIDKLRERLQRLGTINPLAPEEYAEVAKDHDFTRSQLDDLEQAKTTLRELIAELEEAMHRRFLQTFKAVAREFERYFTRLFGGGTARLQFITRGGSKKKKASSNSSNSDDSDDSDDSDKPGGTAALGIEIMARPPGKRQQNLSLLSGGERALTASALLFAILSVNPSPFCVMDEVDAALDESNVGRFREALRDLAARTQFILISHNRGTIEAADTLYGVTMGEEGISSVLSLQVEAAMEHVA